MKLFVLIWFFMSSWTLGAQELPLNPDNYTLLPAPEEEELKTESEEIPLVYSEDERVDEVIIWENEPLVIRPQEGDL